jgi:hypothetical protein
MRTRTIQSFILAMIVLAGTGCCDSRPPSDSQPLAVAEPCSPPPQLPAVFYDEIGMPSDKTPALSELELTQIIDKVATRTKEPIWFLRVKPWHDFSGETVQRGTVIVYLAPQRQTPRIRAGRAYEVSFYGQEAGISSPRNYLQISRADQIFAKQLALPPASDLPFFRPDVLNPNSKKGPPISEDELIRIVDFVRQPSIYKRFSGQRISPEEAQRMPLLGARRFRGNTISVNFGFQVDPGWGYGVQVMVKPTSTGYEVVSCGGWIV